MTINPARREAGASIATLPRRKQRVRFVTGVATYRRTREGSWVDTTTGYPSSLTDEQVDAWLAEGTVAFA